MRSLPAVSTDQNLHSDESDFRTQNDRGANEENAAPNSPRMPCDGFASDVSRRGSAGSRRRRRSDEVPAHIDAVHRGVGRSRCDLPVGKTKTLAPTSREGFVVTAAVADRLAPVRRTARASKTVTHPACSSPTRWSWGPYLMFPS
jgi:hypothetical protein